MENSEILLQKPIGEILKMANLLTSFQIQLALMDQKIYHNMRIGEIFVLRGWLSEKTVDFFADELPEIINHHWHKKIGQYLLDADLLNEEQIMEALKEQQKTGLKFGAITILKGWLTQKTLNFFLEYLSQVDHKKSDFFTKKAHNSLNNLDKEKVVIMDRKEIIANTNVIAKAKKHHIKTIKDTITLDEKLTNEILEEMTCIT